MNFKVTKTETVFSGKVFDVRIDEIEYNNSGNKATRQTAIHPGGAVIIPVTNDGKLVFISQYRFAHDETLLELPAGKLEKGEDPLLCAIRELKEETGYSSNNFTKLGKIYTTPGFCNEVLHIFLAKDLIDGDHAREEGEEGIELRYFSIDEIELKIKSGEIVDSKTLSAVYLYKVMNNL
ncbi:MAG: NUDIX hydrolase [Melioribacteraceae bacterium]|mgnify:CR=1 FL=1|nr:NUDIX hydrolase [Melioribacteraceae bacterium]